MDMLCVTLLLIASLASPQAPALESRAQALSADARYFAWTVEGNRVKLLALEDGKTRILAPTLTEPVIALKFSPSSSELALVSQQGQLQILSIPEGKPQGEHPKAVELRQNVEFPCTIDWMADGAKLLLTGVRARLVQRLTLQSLAEYGTAKEPSISACAVTNDGERFALGDHAGGIRVYSARTCQIERSIDGLPGPIHCLAWNPKGTQLAIGSGDCRVRLYEPTGNGQPRELTFCDQDITGKLAIGSLAFAPDGAALVASSFPWWNVRAWSLEKAQELWTFECGGGSEVPTPVGYLRAGGVAFVGAQGARLDAKSGQELSSLGKGSFQIQGEWCWTRESNAFRLFDIRNGQLVREIALNAL